MNNDYAMPLTAEQMKYTISWTIRNGIENGIIQTHEYEMTFNAATATRKDALLSLSRWAHRNQHAICEWQVTTHGWFKSHLEDFIKSCGPSL